MKRRSVLQAVGGLMALVAGGPASGSLLGGLVKQDSPSFMYRAIALMRRMCDDETMFHAYDCFSCKLGDYYAQCKIPKTDEVKRIEMMYYRLVEDRGHQRGLPVEMIRIADSLSGWSSEDLVSPLTYDERFRIGLSIMRASFLVIMRRDLNVRQYCLRDSKFSPGVNCQNGLFWQSYRDMYNSDDLAFESSEDWCGIDIFQRSLRRLKKGLHYMYKRHGVVICEAKTYDRTCEFRLYASAEESLLINQRYWKSKGQEVAYTPAIV